MCRFVCSAAAKITKGKKKKISQRWGRGKRKRLQSGTVSVIVQGSYKGMSQACLIKIKLYFLLGGETSGSRSAAQVGSHFRLLSAALVKKEEPEVESSCGVWCCFGFYFFASKQSWMLFRVWVFLGCGNWLLWVFCLFSMRRTHCSLYWY